MADMLEFRQAEPLAAKGKTLVMAVLNCTPDSFSDGGRYPDPAAAAAAGLAMLAEGADILDVGGESTRPGASPVAEAEEIGRIGPVLDILRPRTVKPISVDTYHLATAEAALAKGADIINDISGLRKLPPSGNFSDHRELACLISRSRAHVILTHMRGTPAEMQHYPDYGDVVAEVKAFLAARTAFARASGIGRDRIWVDPGFGFGKNFAHNARLLAGLPKLAELGCLMVAGLSRKRMIADALRLPPAGRLEASLALAILAAANGARVVRVHDAAETARATGMLDAIRREVPGFLIGPR